LRFTYWFYWCGHEAFLEKRKEGKRFFFEKKKQKTFPGAARLA
jgi:hypothetical protein